MSCIRWAVNPPRIDDALVFGKLVEALVFRRRPRADRRHLALGDDAAPAP
jgi:hypothetical protein